MSKPYFYLDLYNAAGKGVQPVMRLIPTADGSHARAAFHGIGDGSRSLEVWVQPNGFWSLNSTPGPACGGSSSSIISGRLPVGEAPETVDSPWSTLPKEVRDALATSTAEWLQDRYGMTGLNMDADPSDDGALINARILDELVDAGASLSDPHYTTKLVERCRELIA